MAQFLSNSANAPQGPSRGLEYASTVFRQTLLAALVSATCMAGTGSFAQETSPLHSPFALPKNGNETLKSDSYFACGKPIAPMVDMSRIGTFYKPGGSQSVIDKKAMAAYVKRNELIDDMVRSLNSMVERASTEPNTRLQAGGCILEQLALWAKADGLMGSLDDNSPKGRRQAILISVFNMQALTSSFSVATQSGAGTEEEKAAVEAWFSRLATAIEAEFTPPTIPRLKEDRWLDRNANTRYWAAAAVALLAVNTQDRQKLAWSINVLHEAIQEAAPDGSFPFELSRGTRALHYQNFAMKALTILIAVADANAVKMAPEDERKLAVIAGFTADMFEKPELLSARLGKEQLKRPAMVDWIPILKRHFDVSNPSLAGRLSSVAEPYQRDDSVFVKSLVGQE